MEQKKFNQIVQNMINNMHDTMPDIDTKTGTFLRDVIIDPVSDEFSGLYAELKLMELRQSILTATDTDLDKLAANYFITRKTATNSYGKLRFYISNIDQDNLPDEILIPAGTIISTIATIARPSISVSTTDSYYANKEKIKLLPVDASYPYFYFIEVAAKSINTGSDNNLSAGELSQQVNNVDPAIAFVKNPFSFSGGSDYEDDASLALRINLAISGANIGTKNGYLSYILRQNGVSDAKVVGAGEYMMRRDGGHLNSQGKYVTGDGGMVDIYIRGEQSDEMTYEMDITSYYVDSSNPDPYADIILPVQPVLNVSNIAVIDPNDPNNPMYLINAADYELEKREIVEGKKYYQDILWDFSITDEFQTDVVNYYLTYTSSETPSKADVDKELNEWLEIMTNMNYGLNWTYMTPNHLQTKTFTPYYYTDNRIYMLKSDVLNGLICVKRNDKIYIRIYSNPDYELIKDDILQKGNSVQSQDKIRWLKKDIWMLGNTGSKLPVGNTLSITYNVNELIATLQEGIEQQRVLTADVLIKQAKEVPIEVILNAKCFVTENPETVKLAIISRVTTYIDTLKKLGGEFDLSDIITIAKQVDGVDRIELSGDLMPEIRIIPNLAREKITAYDNEYFKTHNIVVNVLKNDIIN